MCNLHLRKYTQIIQQMQLMVENIPYAYVTNN